MFNKFKHIISNLQKVALEGKMTDKLSAVIIQRNKMVSFPVANSDRSTCRGHLCGSLHAECSAMKCYFGSNLYHHPVKKWSLL